MSIYAEKLYIGLMSGTSLDSIDCVLVSINENKINLLSGLQDPIPTEVRDEIRALNAIAQNDLNRSLRLSRQLGYLFADSIKRLLKKSNKEPEQITAIGCHGQTIRHQPDDQYGFTLQIGDPNTIAEETGICTISDFRSRDIAIGGQGAPLVPLFHHTLFFTPHANRAIVNIGGMANITQLSKSSPLFGFDSGPGNVLLDAWCQKHIHTPFDNKGNWAQQGKVDAELLNLFLSEPYFNRPPPKSTGRELFDSHWLNQFDLSSTLPEDVMATLTELTATSIANSIADNCNEVYICGGGVHNTYLLKRIQAHCSKPVNSIQALGIDPDYVEAKAFAWLAHRRLEHLPGNSPDSTGAKAQRILGAVYAA